MMRCPAARRALLLGALATLSSVAAAQGDAALTAMLSADSAASAISVRLGFRVAVESALDADAVLLYPGAPVITAHGDATTLLAAQPLLDSVTVRWVPVHTELSSDHRFGLIYGITLITASTTPGAEPRVGWYAAAWRARPDGTWRLAALVEQGMVPSSRVVIPAGFHVTAPPPLSAITKPFTDADLAFAQLAHERDARAGFEAYASTQGATLDANGALAIGPSQIGNALAGSGSQEWLWAPVAAGAAGSGELGFTAGEATIRSKSDRAAAPRYSKYLTLWRKESDGRVRFLFDLGNGRPAPR